VGRSRVGKGGVVRDPAAHVDAIEGVIRSGAALGWQALGLVASPITGPAGNHEYLLWLGSGLGGDDDGGGPGPCPGLSPGLSPERGDEDPGAGPSLAGPEQARGLDGGTIRALVNRTLAGA
jgi:hypothetical protein